MLRRSHGFLAWLSGIAAAALAIRLVYALALAPDTVFLSDAGFFHLLGNLLAEGRGFIRPFDLVFYDQVRPTAEHPPAWPVLLAAMSKLGGTSHDAHRVVACLCGTGTVVAIGFLGRRVAGERAGLIAAGLAAVYPLLWVVDGSLMSESLYGLAVALALLAAYRVVEKPTLPRAAVLGAAIGLASLTRGEALMLIVLLAVPVALLARRGLRSRTALYAATVAAFLAVLAPWTIRNWSAFDRPVAVSTNTGTLLAGANCPPTYSGPQIGSWHLLCVRAPQGGNEALEAADLRRDGLDYAREHKARVPVVLAVRALRTWDLFRPRQGVGFARAEGRAKWAEYLGLAAYYALLPLAVWGFLVLRRRAAAPPLLLVGPVMVTLTSLVGYGLTRFRLAAEIAIVVLAAAALDARLERRRGKAAA
jgi:4-amino-4-deoxy-L-arabinose transferase-like glycosyltransferase